LEYAALKLENLALRGYRKLRIHGQEMWVIYFADDVERLHLTRHKISDRARERAWLQAGGTNPSKAAHRSGRGSLHRVVRPLMKADHAR
jgi:hypothetical protein